jgi:MoxR-like ATPase
MQERQVTVEGATRRLERPFVVIATQNPIEYEGTYPLPEAQLDRFLLRARVGYPERADEWRILSDRIERASDDVRLAQVVDGAGLLALQAALERVHVAEPVGYYMVDLVAATRRDPNLELGPARAVRWRC